jgi:hypothetical protein
MNFHAKHEYFRTGQIQSLILLATILQGFFQRASGQASELIAASLVKAGFENTRCIIADDKCYVSIENHTFRWDIKAIFNALEIISTTADTSLEINLLILDSKIPQILIRVESDDWRNYLLGLIDSNELSGKLILSCCTQEAASKLSGAEVSNPGSGKFDLIIYPQIFFENSRTYKFYETQINLAPALEFSLWKGSKFTGQAVIPLHNDLGYEGDHVRPGIVTISQHVKFSDHLSGSLTAGNFAGGYYGVAEDLSLSLFREQCSIELKSGLVGSSHFIDNEWMHSTLNRFTGSLSLAWFWKRFNMELKAGGARFINEDYGLFATCLRRFNETSVGLYVQKNEYNYNGGIFFSIPFPGQKRSNRKFFRILLPPQYEFVYNAGTEYFYGQTLSTELDPIYSDRFKWAESLKIMLINHKIVSNENN